MTFDTIAKAIVDEAQSHLTMTELAASPLGVLAGLTHTEGKQVMDALDAKTVAEFAQSRYVLWAQPIATLARHEKTDLPTPALSSVLGQKWEKKRLRDLAKASPAAFQGLSEKEAKVLADVLGIRSIEELATHSYVLKAQVIAHMAMIEKVRSVRKAA